MKFSAMLCASVLALAALALAADGAFAATTVKSSKSNADYKLGSTDPNADKTCTDKGGTVFTDLCGNKICHMPAATSIDMSPSCTNVFKIGPSLSAKDCTSQGGAVSTNSAGVQVCTLPLPANNNLNSSRSNIYIGTNAEAECKAKSGTLWTDSAGNMICTVPVLPGPTRPTLRPTAPPAPTTPTTAPPPTPPGN